MSKRVWVGMALAVAGTSQAATVLSEGFGNVAALATSGWVFTNNSVTPLGLNWSQGNAGVFVAPSGADDSFAAATFLSTGAATGAISNWMILPALVLDSSSSISFMVRAGGADFLDKLEVRLSTTGTDVGTTTTSVGAFTTLLGTYSASTDGGWLARTYAVGLSAPTSARLAFRYVVDDVAVNGNYLGIDSVTVTAVPEPAAYLMLGLGLAGVALRRRLAV